MLSFCLLHSSASLDFINLVTATGAENLPIPLPRTPDDVEAWHAPHAAAAKAQKAAQIKADALAKKKRK